MTCYKADRVRNQYSWKLSAIHSTSINDKYIYIFLTKIYYHYLLGYLEYNMLTLKPVSNRYPCRHHAAKRIVSNLTLQDPCSRFRFLQALLLHQKDQVGHLVRDSLEHQGYQEYQGYLVNHKLSEKTRKKGEIFRIYN